MRGRACLYIRQYGRTRSTNVALAAALIATSVAFSGAGAQAQDAGVLRGLLARTQSEFERSSAETFLRKQTHGQPAVAVPAAMSPSSPPARVEPAVVSVPVSAPAITPKAEPISPPAPAPVVVPIRIEPPKSLNVPDTATAPVTKETREPARPEPILPRQQPATADTIPVLPAPHREPPVQAARLPDPVSTPAPAPVPVPAPAITVAKPVDPPVSSAPAARLEPSARLPQPEPPQPKNSPQAPVAALPPSPATVPTASVPAQSIPAPPVATPLPDRAPSPVQSDVPPVNQPKAKSDKGRSKIAEKKKAEADEPPVEAEPRKLTRGQCALILERAQIGDLTAEDREMLKSQCRQGR
jgi:hypothetical protein